MAGEEGIVEAELKLTAELLEKLRVFEDVNVATATGYAKDTNTRIDMYGEYYQRLFKAIRARFK